MLLADYINTGHRLPGSDPPQLLYEQHLLNIKNFGMSEDFDNVGVMMLLHYQLMLANPEEEEPPRRKGSTTGSLDPCSTCS